MFPICKEESWGRKLENKGKLKTGKEPFFCAHLHSLVSFTF